MEILHSEHFVLDEFFKRYSLVLFDFEYFLENLIDLFVCYTFIDNFIDFWLLLINDSNFPVRVESKPYFSKIPDQFVILIRVIKKLDVIIRIREFGWFNGPIANDMFHPPIMIPITPYMLKLDLTWL